jgi:uncharacterized protein
MYARVISNAVEGSVPVSNAVSFKSQVVGCQCLSEGFISDYQLTSVNGRKLMTITALWRRLDAPGHDAASLSSRAGGWRLQGTGVFAHEGLPACFNYELDLADDWATVRARILGFIERQRIDATIVREGRGWLFNGSRVAGLESLVDLDLAFTPATNLQHLRRTALQIGEEAEIPVAWLQPGAATLIELPQRYKRLDEYRYWYRAPSVSYEAILELAPNGFVRSYPGLWQLEAFSS